MDVIHAAVWVSDLEATKSFYVDELGLEDSREFVGDDGVVNWFARGEGEGELQFKYDPAETRTIDPGSFDHFALDVEDTDALVEHVVEETDGRLRQEPTTISTGEATVRIAFVEDPDGYGIEFIQQIE